MADKDLIIKGETVCNLELARLQRERFEIFSKTSSLRRDGKNCSTAVAVRFFFLYTVNHYCHYFHDLLVVSNYLLSLNIYIEKVHMHCCGDYDTHQTKQFRPCNSVCVCNFSNFPF